MGFVAGVLLLAIALLFIISEIHKREKKAIEEDGKKRLGLPAVPKEGLNQWELTRLFIWYGIALVVMGALAVFIHNAFLYGVYTLLLSASWYAASVCFVEIPPVHFGVLLAYSGRLVTVFKEGAHWKWPWQDIKLIEMEIKTVEINVGVTTFDKFSLIIQGSLQYRPHYLVSDKRGRNRFIELDETTVRRGIEDRVKDELGIIAGATKYEHFIRDRELIGLIINAVLRIDRKELPHLAGKYEECEHDFSVEDLKIVDDQNPQEKDENGEMQPHYIKTLPEGRDIPGQARFRFYGLNQEKVKKLIKAEEGQSTVERTYGIDVILFAIDSIAFTEETRRKMENVQQAKLSLEEAKKVQEIIKIAEDHGAPDPAAWALAFIGRAKHTNLNLIVKSDILKALANLLEGRGGKK